MVRQAHGDIMICVTIDSGIGNCGLREAHYDIICVTIYSGVGNCGLREAHKNIMMCYHR